MTVHDLDESVDDENREWQLDLMVHILLPTGHMHCIAWTLHRDYTWYLEVSGFVQESGYIQVEHQHSEDVTSHAVIKQKPYEDNQN